MAQLQMIFNAETTPLQDLRAAENFEVRAIDPGELDRINALRAGIKADLWTPESAAEYLEKGYADGWFAAVEKSTGILVANANAERTDHPEFPDWGVLGHVYHDPAFAGRHLGRSVSAAVMHFLVGKGHRILSLKTDDWRIPALITYLRLGWQPWLYEDDMPERWTRIAEKLNISYDSMRCIPGKEPSF